MIQIVHPLLLMSLSTSDTNFCFALCFKFCDWYLRLLKLYRCLKCCQSTASEVAVQMSWFCRFLTHSTVQPYKGYYNVILTKPSTYFVFFIFFITLHKDRKTLSPTSQISVFGENTVADPTLVPAWSALGHIQMVIPANGWKAFFPCTGWEPTDFIKFSATAV